MTAALFKQKLRAFAAHLGLSVLLLGGALAILLLRWFPSPLDITDGAGEGIRLLVGVDLVLGPLLTFIVFDSTKSRRAIGIDFCTIVLLQLSAFGYGLFNIHKVRVQAVAYWQGAFHTVTPEAYVEQDLPADAWAHFGSRAPFLVSVHPPRNNDEETGVAAMGLMAGLEPPALHFLYDPFAPAAAAHWPEGWSLEELRQLHPAVADAAERWQQDHKAERARRFYRVEGYRRSAVMVVDDKGLWLGGFEGELPAKPGTKPVASPSSPSPKS